MTREKEVRKVLLVTELETKQERIENETETSRISATNEILEEARYRKLTAAVVELEVLVGYI